jgi:hypothetical protein
MFSRIRRRLTFANVAMTLALVFAMSGGAYAAKKYLITSTKQISPKVLSQLRGNTGPKGETGPQGAKGEAGPAGKDGTNGTNGKDGAQGPAGATGPAGPTGQTGYVATLPKGATEKGVWVNGHGGTAGEVSEAAISFTIPISKTLTETHIHYLKVGQKGEGKFEAGVTGKDGENTGCPTSSGAASPEAEEGNLCVFAEHEENAVPLELGGSALFAIWNPETGEFKSAGKTGAMVLSGATNSSGMNMFGTWAVTG